MVIVAPRVPFSTAPGPPAPAVNCAVFWVAITTSRGRPFRNPNVTRSKPDRRVAAIELTNATAGALLTPSPVLPPHVKGAVVNGSAAELPDVLAVPLVRSVSTWTRRAPPARGSPANTPRARTRWPDNFAGWRGRNGTGRPAAGRARAGGSFNLDRLSPRASPTAGVQCPRRKGGRSP